MKDAPAHDEPAPLAEAAPQEVNAAATEPDAGSPRRGRLARLLLLAGTLAAAAIVLPYLPREREIELRIDDAPHVTAIDVAWSREGGEAVQGGSWRFEAGNAPRSLVTSVHLPQGRYELEVTIQRAEVRDEVHRVVDLRDTDRVTIPIH